MENADCDDGQFCTGTELCAPEASGADARGCVPSAIPCLAIQRCVEATETCETLCEVMADADGDGVDAMECGGDDCDDSDPDRFPGNAEACDSVDQDCDETTYGDQDRDGDGEVSAMCCNGAVCGPDCDDTRPAVSSTAGEVCNRIDDDCDGTIDEEVLVTFYRDVDGDLYGVDDDTVLDCSLPAGYAAVGGDCNDAQPDMHPGLPDVCDGLDNDCNGTFDGPDEDDDDDGYVDVACGGDDCEDEVATVFPGATEVCDGYDTDCNGSLDGPNEDTDGDGAPSCGTPMDCDDSEARTGVCDSGLQCHAPVCGCEVTLEFDWGGLDLDRGRIFGTFATGDVSTIDFAVDPAAGALAAFVVGGGATHNLVSNPWWGVPDPPPMLGSMGSSIPMSADGSILLFQSNRGFYYRLSFLESRPNGVRFVYSPYGASVAPDFSCP